MNLEHANRLITWTSQSHPSKTYRSLYCIDTISERPLLRGLIVWLFTLCLSGAATAAADQSPNCLTPAPHDGRAESAAVTFSVLGVDGTPAGTDTVWQPLGGTISFSLKGSGLSDKPPIVCLAYHGGPFAPSPRVWLQSNDTATNTLVYNATVPPKLTGPPQHIVKFFTAARRRPVGKDPGDRAGWQRLGPD